MEWLATIIVAIISGGAGVASSLIVARNTTTKLIFQIEKGQAVQEEKVSNYQRITNEKIDDLRQQMNAQAEWGTRIALLEADIRRLKEEKK